MLKNLCHNRDNADRKEVLPKYRREIRKSEASRRGIRNVLQIGADRVEIIGNVSPSD
jgi:hypothetical protein